MSTRLEGAPGAPIPPIVVVQISRGDELPKKNYETKVHPTYETTVRLKLNGNWSEPYVSTKFFDMYRGLNYTLIKAGCVVSSDSPFPPTKRRSIIGVKLDEGSLQERCYMLNQWVNAVFESYYTFSEEGQTALKDFLLSNSDNEALVMSILKALCFNKEKEKPKIEDKSETHPPKKEGVEEEKVDVLSSVAITLKITETDPENENENEDDDKVSPLTTSPSSKNLNSNSNSNQRASINTAGTAMTTDHVIMSLAELEKLSVPTDIGDFLMVHVMVGGDKIPKNDKDTKLHHAYELRLNILPYEGVPLACSDRDLIDVESYNKLHLQEQVTVTYTFDRYRELKHSLEEFGLYSQNSKVRPEKVIHIIEAVFPRTFKKSSFGISLTDAELDERAILLNAWIGQVLLSFYTFQLEAQEEIRAFLTLDETSDPATEANANSGTESDTKETSSIIAFLTLKATISAMLQRKFKPLQIQGEEEEEVKRGDKKAGSQKEGGIVSRAFGYSSKGKGKDKEKEGKDKGKEGKEGKGKRKEDSIKSEETLDTGCACTIM